MNYVKIKIFTVPSSVNKLAHKGGVNSGEAVFRPWPLSVSELPILVFCSVWIFSNKCQVFLKEHLPWRNHLHPITWVTSKSQNRYWFDICLIHSGYLDVLSYLVNDLGVDAEAEDKEGFNSVHAATQASQTQCVKVGRAVSTSKFRSMTQWILWIFFLQWLVAKLGSRYIVRKTGKDGATPLHMAAGTPFT